MRGSEKDYDFGQKRHWRRWAWNRIAERSDKNGLVMYMPSAHDEDREIALSKGFNRHNLIGIERNKRALHLARASGSLVACGDVFRAVQAAALSQRVSVAFADLCCGTTRHVTHGFVKWLTHPDMMHTTFAFNLQRGRENDLKEWRALVGEHLDRHRGMQLFNLGMSVLLRIHSPEVRQGHMPVRVFRREDLSDSDRFVWDFLIHKSDPVFNSYRSGTLVFDSVVLSHPLRAVAGQTTPDQEPVRKQLRESLRAEPGLRGSVAAVLAHRTMRLRRLDATPA